MAWEQLAEEFSPFGLQDRVLYHVSIGKPFSGVDMDIFLRADTKESGGAACHWNILAPGSS